MIRFLQQNRGLCLNTHFVFDKNRQNPAQPPMIAYSNIWFKWMEKKEGNLAQPPIPLFYTEHANPSIPLVDFFFDKIVSNFARSLKKIHL